MAGTLLYPGDTGAPDAGNAPSGQMPTAQRSPAGVGNSATQDKVPTGDALAIKALDVEIAGVQNDTRKCYVVTPYACRLRAIRIASGLTTDAGKTVTILVQDTSPTSAVDIFTNGTPATGFVFDASPVLTADKCTVVSSGTPSATVAALTAGNIERLAQDHVLTATCVFSNDAAWANVPFKLSFLIEPQLVDASQTTQSNRAYVAAGRGVDA